jgi:hypothetical protein
MLSYNVLELLLKLPAPKPTDSAAIIFASGEGPTAVKGKRKSRGEHCSPTEVKDMPVMHIGQCRAVAT